MKHFFKGLQWICTLIAVFTFVSCSDDDPGPSGTYASGVFVINEGNFGDGDGSISFYNRDTQEAEQTIFQAVNEVEALGDVVQSAVSYNGLTYLIVNNSNKVEVVNSYTFESQFTMEGVELPRYMTVANGKGYLTEWVSFTDPGKVSVFNLETGTIDEEIEVGALPEDIVVVDDKIYVTEAFSSDKLYIIDMSDDNSITTLTPGNSTNQLVLDNNNDLWVGCGGSNTGDPNYTPNNDGRLVKIDTKTDQITTTIELNTNYAGKIAVNTSGTQVYYYVSNSVFSVEFTSTSASSEPLFTVDDSFGFYGIGVDPLTGNIYVSDPNDYILDGEYPHPASAV